MIKGIFEINVLKPQYLPEAKYFSNDEMYRMHMVVTMRSSPKLIKYFFDPIDQFKCGEIINKRIFMFYMDLKIIPLFTFCMLNILIFEREHIT